MAKKVQNRSFTSAGELIPRGREGTNYFNDDMLLGINEGLLDDIMLNLNNDIDLLMSSLNSFKMKINDSKEYFKGDVADSIQEKCNSYFRQFDTIKQNLNSYVDDMRNIKIMMGKIDLQAKKDLGDFTDDTLDATDRAIKEREEKVSIQEAVMTSYSEYIKNGGRE